MCVVYYEEAHTRLQVDDMLELTCDEAFPRPQGASYKPATFENPVPTTATKPKTENW